MGRSFPKLIKELMMRQKVCCSMLVLASFASGCTTAPAPAPAAASSAAVDRGVQQETNADASNERICREVQGTGWRFGNREECKTRAEWDRIDGGQPSGARGASEPPS